MSRKFAFTTAAMAAALEETAVSYEDLADIEREFEDVETEIIRQQVSLTTPLYTRRQHTVSQIPNFWPLVLEQAPPDIDQYIQPSDSALLLSSLTSLSVSHFEIDDPNGDPRSVCIRWEFAPNEYFEDTVLEKRFWHRRASDGWTGLVSEPVRIQWKKSKDLTGGLLELVFKAWEVAEVKTTGKETEKEKKSLSPEQLALKKKIENTGMGGLSFFAWFGFIGRRITAAESRAATEKERERSRTRKDRKQKATIVEDILADQDDDEEDENDVDMSLEIFPDGDDLAIAITEDLWPGAIKYFTQAQEQDALSDADFESDDADSDEEDVVNSEDPDDSEGGSAERRPKKKPRAS